MKGAFLCSLVIIIAVANGLSGLSSLFFSLTVLAAQTLPPAVAVAAVAALADNLTREGCDGSHGSLFYRIGICVFHRERYLFFSMLVRTRRGATARFFFILKQGNFLFQSFIICNYFFCSCFKSR